MKKSYFLANFLGIHNNTKLSEHNYERFDFSVTIIRNADNEQSIAIFESITEGFNYSIVVDILGDFHHFNLGLIEFFYVNKQRVSGGRVKKSKLLKLIYEFLDTNNHFITLAATDISVSMTTTRFEA
jgi:hypothetical protein